MIGEAEGVGEGEGEEVMMRMSVWMRVWVWVRVDEGEGTRGACMHAYMHAYLATVALGSLTHRGSAPAVVSSASRR